MGGPWRQLTGCWHLTVCSLLAKPLSSSPSHHQPEGCSWVAVTYCQEKAEQSVSWVGQHCSWLSLPSLERWSLYRKAFQDLSPVCMTTVELWGASGQVSTRVGRVSLRPEGQPSPILVPSQSIRPRSLPREFSRPLGLLEPLTEPRTRFPGSSWGLPVAHLLELGLKVCAALPGFLLRC